jgi:hypothetical protein
VQRRLDELGALLHDVVREARATETGEPPSERAKPARLDVQALAVTTLASIEGYYQLAAATSVVSPGSAAPELRRLLRRALPRRRES